MKKTGYKLEILTEIPLTDEQILDNKTLCFKIDGTIYHFNQFTYKTFNDFNRRLRAASLDIFSFPDKSKFEERKDFVLKLIIASNDAVNTIIDIIVNYAVGWQGCRLIPAFIYKYRFIKKIRYCYIDDILILFEKLLEFNWKIKKKLLNILQKDPRQADPLASETLQHLPKEHLDMIKAGIPIPRF